LKSECLKRNLCGLAFCAHREAGFPAAIARNRECCTIAWKMRPRPITSAPLLASTSKIRRRPSICTSLEEATTVAPTGNALRWSTSTRTPTCIDPGGRAGRMAFELANSISPIIAGVEKTAGQFGLIWARVNSWVTTRSQDPSRPGSISGGIPWVIANSLFRRLRDSSRGMVGFSTGFPRLR
jgi:hypothetical protein